MNEAEYRKYVAAFNSRDYEALDEFFADDVVLQVLGYELRGKSAIRRFYGFFHEYVRETVMLRRFAEGEGISFADVVIRFEGLKELTPERLEAEGFGKMSAVPAGGRVEVQFFISYESSGGKLFRIRCGVFEGPGGVAT